jgi:hypothetical protein
LIFCYTSENIKNDIVDIDEADKWLNQAVAEEKLQPNLSV